MKIKLSLAFFVFACVQGFSQNFPGFNQYLVNPYLVNPSSLLLDSDKSIDLFYRSQWSGFEDAPTTINLNGGISLSKAFKLGAMITHDEVVLQSTTQAKLSGIYSLPIGKSNLGIGFSGGANFFRVTVENPNDPVFNNTGNSVSFHADFGFTYQIKNFTIGASLPAIISNNPFNNSESANTNLKDQIYYMSYNGDLGQKLNIQINGLYKISQDDFNFFEGTALLEFNKKFAVGGFYRQNNGPGIILRFRMTNINTAIGYSNEIASSQTGQTVGSTHEFNIGLRVPKKELPPEIETPEEEEEDQPQIAIDTVQQIAEPIVTTVDTLKSTTPLVDSSSQVTSIPEKEPLNADTDTVTQDLPVDYVLIIGTFNSASNAVNYLRKMKQMGYQAEMKFFDKLRYYYVILPEYSTQTPNVDTVTEFRKTTQFKDAWFKIDW